MSEGTSAPAGRPQRRQVDAFHEPDPDLPGWHRWGPREGGHFNDLLGPMWVRPDDGAPEGVRRGIVRIVPPARLTSPNGTIHGGALLGFVDIALFAGTKACGIADSSSAVTLDITVQFMAAARAETPLEAVVEIMRETGRLLFLRGEVRQEGARIAGITAIVRKPARG